MGGSVDGAQVPGRSFTEAVFLELHLGALLELAPFAPTQSSAGFRAQLDAKGNWEQWAPHLTQLQTPYHPGTLHIHILSWDLLHLQCNNLAKIVGCRRQYARMIM